MNKIIAIAIEQYSDATIKDLNCCRRDINVLIDTLSNRYQFAEIELFTRPEQTTLSFLYQKLYDLFINSLESDSILLLHAGHGEYNPTLGTSYWLCSDSINSDVTTWFNVAALLDFFKASSAKHIALITDSCYSGAIFETNRGGGASALDLKMSRQALTSGGIEKVSDGDDNSPFCLALVKVLKENTEGHLSFGKLSELTILEFDIDKKQTPNWGPLHNSGDMGGTLVLKLQTESREIVKSMQIALKINPAVRINSSFKIPFFNENQYFRNDFINVSVQQFIYTTVVNEIRNFVEEDEDYAISRSNDMEFYVEVDYAIQKLDENFLSITISRSDYFGGLHPNHYMYGINFACKPDRQILLKDILGFNEFSELKDFLIVMSSQFANAECSCILEEYLTYENASELYFAFNEKTFTVYFLNLLPHAIKAYGTLEIPVEHIELKI